MNNLSRLSLYLLLSIALSCAIVTLGQPLFFDRLMVFSSILGAIIVYRIDKDLFSVITIIACSGVLSELMWLCREIIGDIVNYVLPILICFVSYQTRVSYSGKIGFLISMIVIFANIHWSVCSIPVPKGVSWFLIILFINQLIILALLYRPHFLKAIGADSNSNYEWLSADTQLMFVVTLFIMLESLVIFEYILRHSFMLVDYLYVYNSYEYIAQALHLTMFIILFKETYISVRKNIFLA